jgi:hypothetical protein
MLSIVLQNTIAPAKPVGWTEAILISGAALIAAIPALSLLYLVKSALGINLMDAPSPLHDLLYHFVR